MTKKQNEMRKFVGKDAGGITLIALVITIVVLIILAGVTINLSIGNNGLFNKAKQAREEYKQAELNEQKAINKTAEYIENIDNSEKRTITSNNLKAGDYIKYDTEVNSVGEKGTIICRVLYDASSEYGVQIVSNENLNNITLGGNNWSTGRDSYNNAIQTLNAEAEKYLNTKYATDARSIGSVPTIKNGKFINKNSENIEPVKVEFSCSADGANSMKNEDDNYEIDQVQMKKLNMWENGKIYWIASRVVYSKSSLCNFNVRTVNESGELKSGYLCFVSTTGGVSGDLFSYGIRPCFSLKSDIKITGGNGTSEQPYTM